MNKPICKIVDADADLARSEEESYLPNAHFVVDCSSCRFETGEILETTVVGGEETPLGHLHSAGLRYKDELPERTRHLIYVNAVFVDEIYLGEGVDLICPRCRTEYHIDLDDYNKALQEFRPRR